MFVIAGASLALTTAQTSSARFAASTESGANVSSAVLELNLDEFGGAIDVLPMAEIQELSAEPVRSCADIAFNGSTEAAANLLATIADGSGLERHVNVEVLARRGSCTGGNFSASLASLSIDDPGVWLVYDGPLLGVIGAAGGLQLPAGAGRGVEIVADLAPGEQLAVGLSLTLEPSGSSTGGGFVDLVFLVEVTA